MILLCSRPRCLSAAGAPLSEVGRDGCPAALCRDCWETFEESWGEIFLCYPGGIEPPPRPTWAPFGRVGDPI